MAGTTRGRAQGGGRAELDRIARLARPARGAHEERDGPRLHLRDAAADEPVTAVDAREREAQV